MEDRDFFVITEELQRLRDEQQRLRDEQEKLRREKSPLSNGHNGNSPHQGGDKKDDKKDDKEDGSGNSSREKKDETKDDDKNAGDKEKDGDRKGKAEENQPKQKLKQRVQEYARSHPKTILYGAIGLAAACVLAVVLFLYLRSYESTDDAQVDGHLNAVSSRVNGTVTKVYVEDNQTVAAGQLLAELDSNDYQTALDQAKASYATAQAQLAQENPNVPITRTSNQTTISTGESGVQAAQSGVAAAEQQFEAKLAELRQAEANNVKAQTDVERYRPLAVRQEISKEQFDTVIAQAKTQAAAVDSAKAAAKAAQSVIEQQREQLRQANSRLQEANKNAPRNVAIREAGIQARQAAVQAAQAQQEQAELNLSYTKIYAPVAGIVGQKQLEVGQRVETGQQLLSITQIDDIWITANFKETQLKKMKPGQPVDISVDAFSKKYHGYVESMPGATGAVTSLLPPENATGNYVKVVQRLPVRIRLKEGEDPDHILRPGMSVEPKVWLK
jgi:membrane fusion protein (multidrug efflux system)